jgi:glycosyltransferase involved in cell wall biosynthesis
VKILFDNVNIGSRSGPNGFASKLIPELERKGASILTEPDKSFIPDIQLSFIMSYYKFAPIIQRLDGIYFNSEQDFESLNDPIRSTYENAESVIFQSEFNKRLSEAWFGKKEHSTVIHNGTPISLIDSIQPVSHPEIDKFENVWCCASSWRPHKRLKDNVRYFLENKGDNDCLVIAGENPDHVSNHSSVLYSGNLDWPALISLFKKSKYFIHLSWLDHCPNVVIDARASGCHVICSSTGGTPEIAGENSTIILEDEWNFNPVRLYNPPEMDFSKKDNKDKESFQKDISIERAALEYYNFINSTLDRVRG